MKILDRCPATLKAGFNAYSPAALRQLFGGRKVSPILPFASPQQDIDIQAQFLANRQRLSISGYQKKVGLVLEKQRSFLRQDLQVAYYQLFSDKLRRINYGYV